mgnify:CR=1 FL=1
MCAGVQKLSRPIDWCHEMSHSTPTTTQVEAKRDGVERPHSSGRLGRRRLRAPRVSVAGTAITTVRFMEVSVEVSILVGKEAE